MKDNFLICNTLLTNILMLVVIVMIIFSFTAVYVQIYKSSQIQQELYQEVQDIRYDDYAEILKQVGVEVKINDR